jgi:hypothetical protein
MEIAAYGWDQVTVSDVARLIYAARKNSLEQRNITPEGLEEM